MLILVGILKSKDLNNYQTLFKTNGSSAKKNKIF